jgi:hypothetical protein
MGAGEEQACDRGQNQAAGDGALGSFHFRGFAGFYRERLGFSVIGFS